MIYTLGLVMLITLVASIVCFNNYDLESRLMGYPYGTYKQGEWYRLLTAGFIHGDVVHLLFNGYGIYVFSPILMAYWSYWGWWGEIFFLLLYLGAIVMANTISYYKYRNNVYYNHLGASAGVVAVMSAAICYAPTIQMHFFFLPFGIPAGLYLTLYLLMSFSRKDSESRTDYLSHYIGGIYGIVFMILLKYIEVVFH